MGADTVVHLLLSYRTPCHNILIMSRVLSFNRSQPRWTWEVHLASHSLQRSAFRHFRQKMNSMNSRLDFLMLTFSGPPSDQKIVLFFNLGQI